MLLKGKVYKDCVCVKRMVGIHKPNILEIQKYTRQGRLNALLALFKRCEEEGRTADKEKLVAEVCFEWATARRTVLEYLKILKDSGKISEINGKITIR